MNWAALGLTIKDEQLLVALKNLNWNICTGQLCDACAEHMAGLANQQTHRPWLPHDKGQCNVCHDAEQTPP